ncbi:MAG TPA: vancomycin resistance protein, partial [Clostridia bacterium]|nr:vancomycin resistance protein [Clostridia bacterium]
REHWISSEYWGGYIRHNTIARRIYNKSNEMINDEYIIENHAIMMYEPLLGESSGAK